MYYVLSVIFFPSLSVTLATHYFFSVPLLPYFLPVILILALQLYIFLSSHFLVFSSLLSSMPVFPQPSPLSLHQLLSFCLNPSPLLKPLIFFYGLVQPSPDLPVCLFRFLFFFCFILPPSFSYPLPLLPHPPFPLVLSPASFIDY